jgi:hypothetical protein
MGAVVVVYLGFTACLLGVISLVRPLPLRGIKTRQRGTVVLIAGGVLVLTGFVLPARETRVITAQSQLDDFVPVYQFQEFHSIRIHAPKDRVYEAIKAVTADEIALFRTLTWIRRLGLPARESILNPPPGVPLLDVATRTGFLRLAEEPGREIVVGTLAVAPRGWRPKGDPSASGFKALKAPGFALAAMNFRVQDAGPEDCVLTTETRIYATDSEAERKFAAYWRVIYPGSALIRRMWLRAIGARAETSAR